MTDHKALTHADGFIIYSALAIVFGELGHGVLACILACHSLLALRSAWEGWKKDEAAREPQAPP